MNKEIFELWKKTELENYITTQREISYNFVTRWKYSTDKEVKKFYEEMVSVQGNVLYLIDKDYREAMDSAVGESRKKEEDE